MYIEYDPERVEYRTERAYWEYLDGKAFPKVSPQSAHAIVQTTLARIVADAASGLGQTGTEWDIYLPDRQKKTKFIPDVSFWSYDRLRAMTEKERKAPPRAPDLAVEVLSPGDKRWYVDKKIELYLSHGSLVVLDVDPRKRTIRVIDRSGESLLGEEDAFAHHAVPWLRFNVRDVFADLEIPEK